MKHEIEIDGIRYRRVESEDEQLRIVICDNRGLKTFVGYCDVSGDSDRITIRRARCLICWGTNQYIAELANGPLPNTRLGAEVDVTVFRRQVIAVYAVKGNWHVSDEEA